MARNYLIFLVLAGLFASMIPGGGSEVRSTGEPGTDSHRSALRTERGSPSSEPSSGAIELQREYNGHFYADVEINGSPVRVLVDTGASGIALTRSDAQRAGLAVSAGMFEVVGKGANGDVHGEYVMLDRVSLGSTMAERVPAIVLDSGEQSLLGQSFLSKFDTVEIKGDTMVLR